MRALRNILLLMFFAWLYLFAVGPATEDRNPQQFPGVMSATPNPRVAELPVPQPAPTIQQPLHPITPTQVYARTAENEPGVITLSCDGMLTIMDGYPVQSTRVHRMGVVVNLNQRTVSWPGRVAHINKVDEANITFDGENSLCLRFPDVPGSECYYISDRKGVRSRGNIVRGNIDRVTGHMAVRVTDVPMTDVCIKALDACDDPNTVVRRIDVLCKATSVADLCQSGRPPPESMQNLCIKVLPPAPAAPIQQPSPSNGEGLHSATRAPDNANKASALTALHAAERDQLAAQWKLGRMYADGDGVPRDDVRAFNYFTQIVNTHPDEPPETTQAGIVANAFVALGHYYLTGIPNSKINFDRARARDMFGYAATHFGDADAQYELGQLYLTGTPSDSHQAARWLQLAAIKGHCRAEVALGDMLFQGQVVPRQAARGLMWLTLGRDCSARER